MRLRPYFTTKVAWKRASERNREKAKGVERKWERGGRTAGRAKRGRAKKGSRYNYMDAMIPQYDDLKAKVIACATHESINGDREILPLRIAGLSFSILFCVASFCSLFFPSPFLFPSCTSYDAVFCIQLSVYGPRKFRSYTPDGFIFRRRNPLIPRKRTADKFSLIF